MRDDGRGRGVGGHGGAVVIISPWFNYPSLKTASLFLSRR